MPKNYKSFTSLFVFLIGNFLNMESFSSLIVIFSWLLSQDVWHISLLELGSDLIKSSISCKIKKTQSKITASEECDKVTHFSSISPQKEYFRHI